MGQLIYTKQFGTLEVERSFHEPPYHIAKCTNGAYVHISGLPVNNKAELRKAIPVEYLQEALDWFDHRHETEGTPPLRVIVNPDGSCEFEDGSSIESTSQLVQALKPGPMLDAALLWFTKQQIAKEEGEKAPPKKKAVAPAVKVSGMKKTSPKKKAAGSQPAPALAEAAATAG